MSSTNLLVICSDEHNKRFLGCYGHEMVQTPNLDRLAAAGTRFTNAYTPSPICMPARAAMATGRYLFDIENWDNGTPYRGTEADSWGHRLSSQGFDAPTFGKLHFHPESNSGFDEHLPLHAKSAEQGYVGAIASWLGKNQPPVEGLKKEVRMAEIGEFGYTRYDRATAEAASNWIRNREPSDKPWCAFVSFTYPHYPFCAPAEYVNLYDPKEVPLPLNWKQIDWDQHPALVNKRARMGLDEGFTEDEVRWATAVYFGMITFMDAQVGNVLTALENSPYSENTRVIYTSDHGEMLGEHGFWFKGTMHEGSAGTPMIITGPDIPSGHVCHTPVSLVDIYPTVIESVGATFEEADKTIGGQSLVQIANHPDQERAVFSEYHSVAKDASTFMMRNMKYKLVIHIGYPTQLFDVENDRDEQVDLGQDPAYKTILQSLVEEMKATFDPHEVWQRVESYQKSQIERLGGVEKMLSLLENSPMRRPYTPAPPQFR